MRPYSTGRTYLQERGGRLRQCCFPLQFSPFGTPFPDSPFHRNPAKGGNRKGQQHGGLSGAGPARGPPTPALLRPCAPPPEAGCRSHSAAQPPLRHGPQGPAAFVGPTPARSSHGAGPSRSSRTHRITYKVPPCARAPPKRWGSAFRLLRPPGHARKRGCNRRKEISTHKRAESGPVIPTSSPPLTVTRHPRFRHAPGTAVRVPRGHQVQYRSRGPPGLRPGGPVAKLRGTTDSPRNPDQIGHGLRSAARVPRHPDRPRTAKRGSWPPDFHSRLAPQAATRTAPTKRAWTRKAGTRHPSCSRQRSGPRAPCAVSTRAGMPRPASPRAGSVGHRSPCQPPPEGAHGTLRPRSTKRTSTHFCVAAAALREGPVDVGRRVVAAADAPRAAHLGAGRRAGAAVVLHAAPIKVRSRAAAVTLPDVQARR